MVGEQLAWPDRSWLGEHAHFTQEKRPQVWNQTLNLDAVRPLRPSVTVQLLQYTWNTGEPFNRVSYKRLAFEEGDVSVEPEYRFFWDGGGNKSHEELMGVVLY